MEHAGRTGGLPFVGVGWYRTEFDVPQFQAGKRATILFDGAMSHANVYINGQKVRLLAVWLQLLPLRYHEISEAGKEYCSDTCLEVFGWLLSGRTGLLALSWHLR